MIDESVHIVEYSDRWPLLFASEQQRLTSHLDVPASQVMHIGSTAVPGLAAKPIIDIMIGVHAYPPAPELSDGLVALGYEFLGEAGVAGRQYYRIRGAGSFNVHVVQHCGQHWVSNLALRDYLRANEPARVRYANAKRAALEQGATTLLTYSSAKAEVVASLVSEASAFQAHRA